MAVRLGTSDFFTAASFVLSYLKNFSSPIDFNNAFVAFMESAAVYLRYVKVSGVKRSYLNVTVHRDTFSVVRAGQVSRSRSKSDMELGLSLLERSTAQIDRIVCSIGLFKHQLITVYPHA